MNIRDSKGKFIKGQHYSIDTQFKKGEHWRPAQPFREYDWLFREYITIQRSAVDIAKQFNVTENAILFWLHKLNIPRRNMKTIRKGKYWGLRGDKNGMFGVHGSAHPNWQGGITPERQSLYNSSEWSDATKEVWERDKATCRRCGKMYRHQSMTWHIHHIVRFPVRELRVNIHNLVLLCPKCHNFIHSKKNTKKDFLSGQLIAL